MCKIVLLFLLTFPSLVSAENAIDNEVYYKDLNVCEFSISLVQGDYTDPGGCPVDNLKDFIIPINIVVDFSFYY